MKTSLLIIMIQLQIVVNLHKKIINQVESKNPIPLNTVSYFYKLNFHHLQTFHVTNKYQFMKITNRLAAKF